MEALFTVKTPSGRIIRTTLSHWELISTVKHPEILGKENEVRECLADPVEIRRSSEDADVYLYYLPLGKRYLCVVARHLNGEGFIVTAYITDKVKEGEAIWRR